MKLLIIFVLCVASAYTEVWEFGEDIATSILVSHYQGDISLFEKSKKIPLMVPDCYEVDYVKVDVNNIVSTPAVYYNKLSHIVTIAYKPLQISMSTYDIAAKAQKIPSCVPTEPEPRTLVLEYGK